MRQLINFQDFVEDYFGQFNRILMEFLNKTENKMNLNRAIKMLMQTKKNKSKVILIGNGGSAAIAEHMAIDLTKIAGLYAMAISGSPMLTAFANDYGYEKIFQKGVEAFGVKGDVLIAISSSGRSKNIINACHAAREKRMKIITFSGFKSNNPLRELGDINFWINSRAYGYVEILHNLLIHCINDAIIGSAIYQIR